MQDDNDQADSFIIPPFMRSLIEMAAECEPIEKTECIVGVDEAEGDSKDATVIYILGSDWTTKKVITLRDDLFDDMPREGLEALMREVFGDMEQIIEESARELFNGGTCAEPREDQGDLTYDNLMKSIERLRSVKDEIQFFEWKEPPPELLRSTKHDEPQHFFHLWNEIAMPPSPYSALFLGDFEEAPRIPTCHRCGQPALITDDGVICSNWIECDFQLLNKENP